MSDNRVLTDLIQQNARMSKEISDLTQSIGRNTEGFRELTKVEVANLKATNDIDDAIGKLSGSIYKINTSTLSGLKSTLIENNKILYNLSRQTIATGQSFSELSTGIKNLSSSTKLSAVESAKFFQEINNMTVGVKMASSEITELGRVLTREYGPGLEDVSSAMRDLMEIQNKDIDIFKKLKEGMDPQSVIAMAYANEKLHGQTKQQTETMIRYANAVNQNGKELTENELRLRMVGEAQAGLNKKWDTVKMDWAVKLNDLLPKIDSLLTGIVGTLNKIPIGIIEKVVTLGAIAAPIMGTAALLNKSRGLFAQNSVGNSNNPNPLDKNDKGGDKNPFRNIANGTESHPFYVIVKGKVKTEDKNEDGTEKKKDDGKKDDNEEKKPSFNWKRLVVGVGGAATVVASNYYADNYMTNVDKITGERRKTAGGAVLSSFGTAVGTGLSTFAMTGNPYLAAGAAAITLASSFGELNDAIQGTSVALDKLANLKTLKETGVNPEGIVNNGSVLGVFAEKRAVASGDNTAFNSNYNINNKDADNKRKMLELQNPQKYDTWGRFLLRKNNEVGNWVNNVVGDGVIGNYLDLGITGGYEGRKKEFGKHLQGDLKEYDNNVVLKNFKSVEDMTGVKRDDEKFWESTLNLQLIRGLSSKKGLKGKEQEDFIKKLTSGKGSSFEQAELIKYSMNDGNRKRAKEVVSKSFNEPGATVSITLEELDKVDKTQKDIIKNVNLEKLEYDGIEKILKRTQETFTSHIQSQKTLLELSMLQGKSYYENRGYVDSITAGYDVQIEAMEKAIAASEKLKESEKDRPKQIEEITNQLIKANYSQEKARELAKNMLESDVARRNMKAELAGIKIQKTQDIVKGTDVNSPVVDNLRQQQELLQAQADLSKTLYMGMGPTIDLQLKQVDISDQIIEQKKIQLAQSQKDYEIQKGRNADEALLIPLRDNILKKTKEITQEETKKYEVTKNLREGYLDAITSNNNITGSFAKIIPRTGFGNAQILRDYGGPGGMRFGNLGAGSENNLYKWDRQGSLMLSEGRSMIETMNGYLKDGSLLGDRRLGSAHFVTNPDLLNSPEGQAEQKRVLKAMEDAASAMKGAADAINKNGEPTVPTKMATGGLVPGSGTGDTVPAMLTPGERVLNLRETAEYHKIQMAFKKNRFAEGYNPQSTASLSEDSSFPKDEDELVKRYANNMLYNGVPVPGESKEHFAVRQRKDYLLASQERLSQSNYTEPKANNYLDGIPTELARQIKKGAIKTEHIGRDGLAFATEQVANAASGLYHSPWTLGSLLRSNYGDNGRDVYQRDAETYTNARKDNFPKNYDNAYTNAFSMSPNISKDFNPNRPVDYSVLGPKVNEQYFSDLHENEVSKENMEKRKYNRDLNDLYYGSAKDNELDKRVNIDRNWTNKQSDLNFKMGDKLSKSSRNDFNSIMDGALGGALNHYGEKIGVHQKLSSEERAKYIDKKTGKDSYTGIYTEDRGDISWHPENQDKGTGIYQDGKRWTPKKEEQTVAEAYNLEGKSKTLRRWYAPSKEDLKDVGNGYKYDTMNVRNTGNPYYETQKRQRDRELDEKGFHDGYDAINKAKENIKNHLTPDGKNSVDKSGNIIGEKVSVSNKILESIKDSSKKTASSTTDSSKVLNEFGKLDFNNFGGFLGESGNNNGAGNGSGGDNLGAGYQGGRLSFTTGGPNGAGTDNFGGFLGGFATGGLVPGSGTGDTVAAMLTPGERVLNLRETKEYEHIKGAFRKNRFANGGYVIGGGSSGNIGGSSSGVGMPNIVMNVRGDTVDKIMRASMKQLEKHVNQLVAPQGSTGRFFDRNQS